MTVRFAIRHAVSLTVGDRPTLRRLFVRLDVEVDEQQEIARQQEASKHRRSFSSSTGTDVREVREVVGGVVVVR